MNPLAGAVQGDAVHQAVSVLLLAMSVASWSVILWKLWLLRGAMAGTARSIAAFWQAAGVDEAAALLPAFDRHHLVSPMVQACQAQAKVVGAPAHLGAQGQAEAGFTRVIRGALSQSIRTLQSGQVLLASVGAIAPFVGLLGTVWGIYHALGTISSAGQLSIAQVAGPVGEALIMTAAGLAVAIPAVLGYNVLGRLIGRIEADLEGFAHDLLALMAGPAPGVPR